MKKKCPKKNRPLWDMSQKEPSPLGHKGAKKTMSENKAKKVKEIFSDYETKTNIKEAYVTALNVMKKTNTLGIVLEIDE